MRVDEENEMVQRIMWCVAFEFKINSTYYLQFGWCYKCTTRGLRVTDTFLRSLIVKFLICYECEGLKKDGGLSIVMLC